MNIRSIVIQSLLWRAFLILGTVLFVGCLETAEVKVPNSIPAVGNAIAQGKAHVESAEAGLNALKPFIAKGGAAVAGLVSHEHAEAGKSMDTAGSTLASVQNERDQLVASNHKLALSVTELRGEVSRVTGSWGYQLEIWVSILFWLLVSLLAIHFIAAALSIFLPLPYNRMAAIVANVVNPLGWINWLVTHCFHNAQANAAAAKMEMLPPAPAPPPNH